MLQKKWFPIFNVTTAKAYLIKIWLFLLSPLNCWSVCNQTCFDSTASEVGVSCGKMWLPHRRGGGIFGILPRKVINLVHLLSVAFNNTANHIHSYHLCQCVENYHFLHVCLKWVLYVHEQNLWIMTILPMCLVVDSCIISSSCLYSASHLSQPPLSWHLW